MNLLLTSDLFLNETCFRLTEIHFMTRTFCCDMYWDDRGTLLSEIKCSKPPNVVSRQLQLFHEVSKYFIFDIKY